MLKVFNEVQMEMLLNIVGFIGVQMGFLVINLMVIDDGSIIQGKDVDIMIIGGILDKLKDDKQIDLLVQVIESWVKILMCQILFFGIVLDESDCVVEIWLMLIFFGVMVVVIGFQLLYNDQCSVIVLLVDSLCGYEMFNDVVNDSGKCVIMFGLVVVICEFGINSLCVGDVYYVGYLLWFECLWYVLVNYLILLVVLVVISVILLVWVLWCLL